MKKYAVMMSLCLVITMLLTAGCGAGENTEPQAPVQTPEETVQEVPETSEETTAEEQTESLKLEELFGSNYEEYIIETITTYMENRMDKTPEVEFYPVIEEAPLTDYIAIDETLSYELNEDDEVVITVPAGVLTKEEHGEQIFILPQNHE